MKTERTSLSDGVLSGTETEYSDRPVVTLALLDELPKINPEPELTEEEVIRVMSETSFEEMEQAVWAIEAAAVFLQNPPNIVSVDGIEYFPLRDIKPLINVNSNYYASESELAAAQGRRYSRKRLYWKDYLGGESIPTQGVGNPTAVTYERMIHFLFFLTLDNTLSNEPTEIRTIHSGKGSRPDHPQTEKQEEHRQKGIQHWQETIAAVLERGFTEDDLVRIEAGTIAVPALGNDITPLKQFFHEVSQVPLLTEKEEVGLGMFVEMGRRATALLNGPYVNGNGELFLHIQQVGKRAEYCLVRANGRRLIKQAQRFTERGLPFSDLIQEGYIGLLRSAEKFDYEKSGFGTYTRWWMRQSMLRAIARHSRTIRLPESQDHLLKRVNWFSRELLQRNEQEPTSAEIADEYNHWVLTEGKRTPLLTAKKVERIQKQAQFMLSLERKAGDGGEDNLPLIDVTPDTSSPNPLQIISMEQKRALLHWAIATLDPRKQQILRLRYGLVDGEPHSLDEVAELICEPHKTPLSRERIRQLEKEAKLNLLKVLRKAGFKKEDIED